MASSHELVFKVRRSEAVLVRPARPTPMEVKPVSDWDNELRALNSESVILLYKSSLLDARDPVEMIKRALAEALVYYYPFAGRMKEGEDGKLVVDCTAEGVVFVEADADIRLDQFGVDSLRPPFSELLYNKNPGTTLGSPLFTLQVTRLLCGGFMLAFTFNHVISDGFGTSQFLSAIAELAGGAQEPSVMPVWEREILNVCDPPSTHHNTTRNNNYEPLINDMAKPSPPTCRTIFFGKHEVAAIRARIPEGLWDSCSSFELIVACVLHCIVTSLQHTPEEEVGVMFPINCRNKFVDRPIPAGYYGNASFFAVFYCPMEDLHDLGYAVQQVKKAKEAVNEDYARSLLDMAVKEKRTAMHNFPKGCTVYTFNDWSRLGFSTLDFGSWGKPVYAGKPNSDIFLTNLMVAVTNSENGEEGRLLNHYMSQDATDKLQILLDL